MLEVSIYTNEKTIFKGTASRVILPGEGGVFEVLSYHHPLVSRLVSGTIFVDRQSFSIRCGIAGISRNRAVAVVEE